MAHVRLNIPPVCPELFRGLLGSEKVPMVKELKGVFLNSSILFSANKTAVVRHLEPKLPRMAVVCRPTRASNPIPNMAMAIRYSTRVNPLIFLMIPNIR